MHYYLCPYCPPDRESYLYKSHVDDVEYIYEECDDDDCNNHFGALLGVFQGPKGPFQGPKGAPFGP